MHITLTLKAYTHCQQNFPALPAMSAACIDLKPELDVVPIKVCKCELLALFESKTPRGNAFFKKKKKKSQEGFDLSLKGGYLVVWLI